ncbi:MAG: AbrB/MazE/SpoVT family DNA-binding domain-containing protein [Nitrospiraceae bacterium]|nr:AbrB/MazE/SpoVT family DNA-binding domain-containing protein [Nitrospiraceae bacterium]
MPIAVLSSKGQMTIPKEIRKALDLKPEQKVAIVLEDDHAVIKPLKGDILDIGGTVKVPSADHPSDFRRIREEVKKHIGKKAARK